MPRRREGQLTPPELVFIKEMEKGNSPTDAAEKAGYSSPAKRARDLMNRPMVQAELAERQLARLNEELLPQAVNVLNRLLTDTRVPAGAAFNAAKYVIDRALPVTTDGTNKQPHEMNGDELARQIDRLRHEAAVRSGKVIDAVVIEPESASVFD